MRYKTSRQVNASAALTWSVLTNLQRWPEWTPSISSVRLSTPTLRLGAQVEIQQPGLRPATWTVDNYVDGESFTWSSDQPGVRTVGTHQVLIVGPTTRLTLGLEQSGPFAALIAMILGHRIRRYVDLEADGLAAAAEAARDQDGDV